MKIIFALLFSAVAVCADEIVLFDATKASLADVRAQDGATFELKNGLLTVTTKTSDAYPGVRVPGAWNLSRVGRVEVEFVNGGIWGKYTLRLLNAGGNPGKGTGCWIQKLPIKGEKTITLAADFSPSLPEWDKVLPLLTRVRTWALPYMIWAKDTGDIAVWNHPAVGHGVIDRTAVREVAVYINKPRLPHTWSIRRIVAKGVVESAENVPSFAKLPPEKFFPCIDEYGQFKHREWPGKVHSDADLKDEREKEEKDLAAHPGPAGWDKWGGWAAGPQLEATGGFRTVKLKGKWWIVDPDGHLWWSHGPVRVTPSGGITPLDGHENWFERLPKTDEPEALFYTTRDELLYPYYGKRGLKKTYDFSAQNIRRKYGENWFETWADLAHRRLRSWSCNTIANSSDKRICLMGRTPYTERFEIHSRPIAGHKGGWWEFCDPFDPAFRAEAKRMTEVYREEFEDTWCIGFFVDNEHYWGEAHTFGVSTLKSPADQPCKREFVARLKAKYGDIVKLNAAWHAGYASWDEMLQLVKEPADLAAAKPDLEAFSSEIAENYYRIIREELKRVAPGKLYLGCRWAGSAPAFTVKAAAKYCDVLSYNVYRKEMSKFALPEGVDAPVLIGEFHFGALDRGPFCPGLILLKDQTDRAATYRNYVKTSLEHPQIVGVHWHQFSDQSTAGRFDGENMQVGWTDVCDTPYYETVEAIRDIGSRLYEVRYGEKSTLDVSVPFNLDRCASFESAVRDLRRLRTEFGVRRVFITGCPGIETRLVGWSDDLELFAAFGDRIAKLRAAVADVGLEVGWWCAPTLACAKGGPFQFMVGDSGREALHSPCPLDATFVEKLCLRIRTVCAHGRPSSILFEDDLHFNGQRDKTNDNWTGPCCYCPLHLKKVEEKCGKLYTREGLIAAMKGKDDEAAKARAAFAEAKTESMIAFGAAIRKAVDEVSPEITMGMSGNGDLSHGRSDATEYARTIAGRHRPFIRIPCSIYDSCGSFEEMLNWTARGFRNFMKCPRDIERMHEMDTYPHNRFFMPDAIVSALLAKVVAWGGESVLFYGTQYLDDPLESDGYFRCLKRENRKLATLRDELKGMSLAGVYVPEADPKINFFGARYGWPMTLEAGSTTLLAGHAASSMPEAELKALLTRGGAVLDGRCAAIATMKGFAPLMGAEVRPAAEFPVMGEWVEEVAVSKRIPGRHIYNFNFAAPTAAEKSPCKTMKTLAGAQAETLVTFLDACGKPYAPSVMRVTTKDGRRFGLISTTLTENRSAALFSIRKREVLADLLEWTSGREIPVRVADERNVEVIASESADGRKLVVTALVLRADVINGLDLLFAGKWLAAGVEELGSDGVWRACEVGKTAYPRILHFGGEFRPGIARIFRFTQAGTSE